MAKRKTKKKRDDINDEAEEVAQEIYDYEDEAVPNNFEKPSVLRWAMVKYTLISSIIGLFAGAAAALWLFSGGLLNFDSALIDFYPDERQARIEKFEQVTVPFEDRVSDVVESVSPSVVAIVRVPDGEENIAWPFDIIGLGAVVTNDGWILAAPSSVEGVDLETIRILTSDGSSYSILQSYQDWLEPLLYIRVAAYDLQPVNFGERDQIKPGQLVFSVAPGASRYSTQVDMNRISEIRRFSADDLASAVFTSEVFPTRLLLGKASNLDVVGAPLFDLTGSIIGFITDKESQTALPVDVITHANKSFFSEDQVVRTWLGVRYLDLSLVVGLPETMTYGFTRGALIYGGDGEAIEKNSPADVAELKTNDIILDVEGELVNGRYNLTELIQSYAPGKEVNLLILRDGKKQEIQVKLGELK